MKIFVLPKTHFSFPFRWRTGKNIEWQYKIKINSRYNHNSEDQLDFNKLIGIKSSFFKPKKNSIMIGYRWNLDKKCNDLVYYFHNNGGREWSDILFNVKSNQEILIRFKTTPTIQTVTVTVGNKSISRDFNISGKRWYLINTWFGGNRTPSNIQTFNITKLKWDSAI